MYFAQRGKIYNFFNRSFGGESSRRGGSGRSGGAGRRRWEVRGEEGNKGGGGENLLEVQIRRHPELHEKFLGRVGREPGKRSAETSGKIEAIETPGGKRNLNMNINAHQAILKAYISKRFKLI